MISQCCHTDPREAGAPMWPWQIPACPWCGRMPYGNAPMNPQQYVYLLHQEMIVDPASPDKENLVGGVAPAEPTLEYMPVEGAVSPSVTLKCIQDDGTVTTIDEPVIEAGYHVKDDIAPVDPGTRLQLTVKECLARVRYLETIEY